MHQVEAGTTCVLLDCGLSYGPRAELASRNRAFPFRPQDIRAVLLSHAHLDHCGNLPNLVRQGFRGPIYCTAATRALAAVLLGDAAKIQEEEAAYLNRQRLPGTPFFEPLFDGRDVFRTLLQLQAVPYNQPVEVAPGWWATFSEAGHLLGAAHIHLRIACGGREHTLTYTGDHGRRSMPIVPDPAPLPPADLIISECTYGGQRHESAEETLQVLAEVVCRTLERGGKLLIPAFSVGRTQTLLYLLHQLRHSRRIPEAPVYVDSPLAVRATEVFQAHRDSFSLPTQQRLAEYPDLFNGAQVHFLEKMHESVALNDCPEPCVIVAGSGMCEGGRILFHLKRHLSDPRCTVLLVSFQAEGTLGRRLLAGAAEVRLLGRTLPVCAEIVALNGLSSHADHADLVADLAPLAGTSRRICLVHGEPAPAEALAQDLRRQGFPEVLIPQRGDSSAA
jgi:metallo-beta-lactamase family protein